MENIENVLFNAQHRVIDNRNLKMTDVLKYLLLREDIHTLDVAVGYFYISGLLLLKDEFTHFMDNKNGRFRILMGNETNNITSKILDKTTGDDFVNIIRHTTAEDTNKIDDYQFLARVKGWIQQDRISAKVYTGDANYFHAKSYLFANSMQAERGTAIVGSSNFSRNGLEGNTELNVLSEDNYYALHRWYSELWFSDETQEFSTDLIKTISSNLPSNQLENQKEYIPVAETYYDFSNLFAKPYAALDDSKTWVKGLYPHQRTGIVAIKDKLDTFGTAVLSDGVGLGKTRTAAGVIRLYREGTSPSKVLILADTKLKDQWTEELKTVGVMPSDFDYMSRDAFNRLTYEQVQEMKYSLVVIDEAHLGFKNNNTQSYNKMMALRMANSGIKGLMLTATPWNNHRDDVINIGMLFINPDQVPNDRVYKQYLLLGGLTNKMVKKMADDDKAFNEFFEDIYLQRTRKTYGGQGAKFPEREFPTVDIPYEPNKNIIFSDNFERIADLKFPYMDPIKYFSDSRESLGANQLKLLLLKRADSSWIAYKDSLSKIMEKIKHLKTELTLIAGTAGKEFLSNYRRFLYKSYGIFEYERKNGLIRSDDQEVDLFESTVDQVNSNERDIRSKIRRQQYIQKLEDQINGIKLKQAKNIVSEMLQDSTDDLQILSNLINELDNAYSKIDEKLTTVIQQVSKEIQHSHKIIIITQFADTAEYYYDALYNHFNSKSMKLPMGIVTGGAKGLIKINQEQSTKKDVLDHFSPKSKGQLEILQNGEDIQLIVGTDAISTGQNLQDAVTLMNIDLPYNPMILEQRIGRIDRPRPNHDQGPIYIYTFPVYNSIESQLKMAKRLGTKMQGVLEDTQFDNVVLPEYKHYLENIKAKKANAVESMLSENSSKYLSESSMSSEKHSEQYRQANKRMYDYKLNGIHRLEKPLIPKYSFAHGKNDSIVIGTMSYKDTNGSLLKKDNIVLNLSKNKIDQIVDAEKELRISIPNDVRHQQKLSLNKASELAIQSDQRATEIAMRLIDKYNSQQSTMGEGIKQLTDKKSSEAGGKLRTSARVNRQLVISSLAKLQMEPRDLATLARYIETIQKDDPIYELVKIIANDVNYFWTHIEEYSEVLNLDTIKHGLQLGAQRENVDLRKADQERSKFNVLFGNIVIND